MPLYEYRCRDCEDEFEIIQRISDRILRTCRKCGGRLEKLLSKTSFVLKGSGWYADGYSGGPAKGAAPSGSKEDGGASSASSSGGSAGKPESGGAAKKSGSGGSGSAS